jgi:hypothetical protein
MNKGPHPSTDGRCLCLVRSSLQFILALALAEHRRTTGSGPTRIVFLPDVLEPDLLEQAVAAIVDPPCEPLVVVRSRRQPGLRDKTRSWRALQRDIADVLVDAQADEVTIFNDREDAGQLTLIETARRFPQALRSCVEDGAHAYRDFKYRAHGLLTRVRQRWRYGPQWSDVRILGTHPLVQRYSAIHPLLLRPELRGNVVQFPAAQLDSPPLRQFAGTVCRLVGFDPRMMPAQPLLLSVSSSTYARRNPDYAAMMQATVAHLRDTAQPFLFKYHPREPQADYLQLASTPRALEIPRTIPLECVYTLARERPMFVIGGMSTSLMMAVLLVPRASAAALAHATDVGDRWDAAQFAALRITSVSDIGGLAPALAAWRQASGGG